MIKKNVAVLFGGQSSEHEVSKISAFTIMSNLSSEKYNIIPIYISKSGAWKMYDGPIQNILTGNWEEYSANTIISPDPSHKGLIRIVGESITFIPVDIVFPVLHGKYGEDGTIQGLLELAKIPYVGCGVSSSSISMDKVYTKIVVDSIGISQAKYKVFYKHEINKIDHKADQIEDEIGYPCFIKPANAGSSVGISKATNKQELIDGINLALKQDSKVLIEEFINARELECAVLGNTEIKTSVVGEVEAAAEFYDFDAKYNNEESKVIIPADIEPDTAEKIKESAKKIFEVLGCRGLSRVDFFLDKDKNKIIFNEINTLPGFTSISMYHMLWRESGIKISELLDKLISLGFEDFEYKFE